MGAAAWRFEPAAPNGRLPVRLPLAHPSRKQSSAGELKLEASVWWGCLQGGIRRMEGWFTVHKFTQVHVAVNWCTVVGPPPPADRTLPVMRPHPTPGAPPPLPCPGHAAPAGPGPLPAAVFAGVRCAGGWVGGWVGGYMQSGRLQRRHALGCLLPAGPHPQQAHPPPAAAGLLMGRWNDDNTLAYSTSKLFLVHIEDVFEASSGEEGPCHGSSAARWPPPPRRQSTAQGGVHPVACFVWKQTLWTGVDLLLPPTFACPRPPCCLAPRMHRVCRFRGTGSTQRRRASTRARCCSPACARSTRRCTRRTWGAAAAACWGTTT